MCCEDPREIEAVRVISAGWVEDLDIAADGGMDGVPKEKLEETRDEATSMRTVL